MPTAPKFGQLHELGPRVNRIADQRFDTGGLQEYLNYLYQVTHDPEVLQNDVISFDLPGDRLLLGTNHQTPDKTRLKAKWQRDQAQEVPEKKSYDTVMEAYLQRRRNRGDEIPYRD
jgi:hypothetical protein